MKNQELKMVNKAMVIMDSISELESRYITQGIANQPEQVAELTKARERFAGYKKAFADFFGHDLTESRYYKAYRKQLADELSLRVGLFELGYKAELNYPGL